MPLLKLNSPIPVPLPKECQKCAKILQSFVDSANNGLDGVIPRHVLENARGFAIFTVFKAGFVVSARAGSGVVIARLDDGSWSAPSAIGTAGMGFGGQAGAEVTDFLVVLNSISAVRSFMSAGSLTLGGNMSIAIGPLGRNGEAVGSLNTKGRVAAMYSYSKTKGLFGGVSVEGSILVERQDANAIAYEADVSVKQLLSGVIPLPPWAGPLIHALERCTGMPGGREWVYEDRDDWSPGPGRGYHFGGVGTPPPESVFKRRTLTSPFGRKVSSSSDSYFPSDAVGEESTGNQEGNLTRKKSLFRSKSTRNGSFLGSPSEIDGFSVPDVTGSGRSYSTVSPQNGTPNRIPPELSHTRSSSSPSPFESTRFPTYFDSGQPSVDPFSLASISRTSQRVLSDFADPSDSRSSRPAEWESAAAVFDPLADLRAPHQRFSRRVSGNVPPLAPIDIFDEDPNLPLFSPPSNPGPMRRLSTKRGLRGPDAGLGKGIALFDYNAQQAGDLSFKKGEVIIILKRTDSSNDWWTGLVDHRQGIFPANFIEVYPQPHNEP